MLLKQRSKVFSALYVAIIIDIIFFINLTREILCRKHLLVANFSLFITLISKFSLTNYPDVKNPYLLLQFEKIASLYL